MNWWMIAAAVILPPPAAFFAARPLWRRGRTELGNVLGTAVLLLFAIAFGGNEYVIVERLRAACDCALRPTPFMRFATFVYIAFAEVIALYWLSLIVTERAERGQYWQTSVPEER
jgi:hypothetical protein